MRWHLEMIVEACLLIILWLRSAPRWFSVLIGVDFAASLLQLLPYRFGLHQHSRLIWESGIVIAAPLNWMAMIEAGELGNGIFEFWHRRLLAFWIAGNLCILSLQTQPDLVLKLNTPLLVMNAGCFVAWIVLFLER